MNDPEPRIENPSTGPSRCSNNNDEESTDDKYEIRKMYDGDDVSEYIHI